MRASIKITELTREDLVDLLCTATYGSSWLECYAPDREGLDIMCGDCREDIWAKALLAGKKIECIDHYAEGEVYDLLGHVDDDGDGIYLIGLDDIRRGLENALNGIFDGDDSEKRWARECAEHFLAGEGEMDNSEAECLMQIIMFRGLIYG